MADFAKLLGEKMAKAAEANRAPAPEAGAKPAKVIHGPAGAVPKSRHQFGKVTSDT